MSPRSFPLARWGLWLSLPLVGCSDKAAEGPGIEISAETLDFGSVPVGTAGELPLTITNTGGETWSVLSVTVIEGSASVWGVSGGGSADLAPGESLDLAVVFTPAAEAAEAGRLQIRTTFPGEDSYYVDLAGVGAPSTADADGDGYSAASGDCDDAEPAVYPGADEICDGYDNDCDGAGASGEIDADNDGSYVCGGDCDDANPTIYPEADELCDGVDTDCDGDTPDYEDDDGDGYTLCDGDCDDADAGSSPGQAEICDGADNDCSGQPDDQDEDGDGASPCLGDCDDADASAAPVVWDPLSSWKESGLDVAYVTLEDALAAMDDACRTILLAPGEHAVSEEIAGWEVTILGAGASPDETVITPPKGSPAFSLTSGASVHLQNLAIRGAQTADDGAAVRASGADLALTNVLLEDNVCAEGDGGAVAVASGSLRIQSSAFARNVAGDDGGAVVVLSGDLVDSGSTYTDNSAARGGAIRAESASVELADLVLQGNHASSEGGGLSVVGGAGHRVERCEIWSNTADLYGGGLALAEVADGASVFRNLWVQDNAAGSSGGGAWISGNTAQFLLVNSTFVANAAGGAGAGVHADAGDSDGLYLWSNVLYWNDGASGIATIDGSGASVAYTTAWLTTSGVDFAVGALEDGGENEEEDPLLRDASDDGDPADDDVGLEAASPARNSGPIDGFGPETYTTWQDRDGSRNDRGVTGGPGAD